VVGKNACSYGIHLHIVQRAAGERIVNVIRYIIKYSNVDLNYSRLTLLASFERFPGDRAAFVFNIFIPIFIFFF